MMITHLRLANWRNFKHLDISLSKRLIIVGPNGVGKSNLLDAFRFLRDVATSGLSAAVDRRGGLSRVCCISAANQNQGLIDLDVTLTTGDISWQYLLQFGAEGMGRQRTLVRQEIVKRNNEIILQRPDTHDDDDQDRLTQTALEQTSANQAFRTIQQHFSRIGYVHLVPQIVREPGRLTAVQNDPFGSDFIARINSVSAKTRQAWLKHISSALQTAVPQLSDLDVTVDKQGAPHLSAAYKHWPRDARQDERDLSDGELRLLGLLWSIVELQSGDTLLLEEPESSLDRGVVRVLPSLLSGTQRHKSDAQIVLTTHSFDLLSDEGIAPNEVLLLTPTSDATTGILACDIENVTAEIDAGLTIPEAIGHLIKPDGVEQLVPLMSGI